MTDLKSVSLFSNCGAGDVGFRRAGFQFEVMAELDPRRLSVALANHPEAIGVAGDLRETWTDVVAKWRELNGDIAPSLLAACPPCQGMSSARSGRGKSNDHEAGGRDKRNLLVTVIVDVARELKPRSIVVENVPAFLTRAVPHPVNGTPISAALLLISELESEYEVFAMTGDLADWGVPQTRRRAFLTLLRRSEAGLAKLTREGRSPFPRPSHVPEYGGNHITLREALAKLDAKPLDAAKPSSAVDPLDPMHRVPVWDLTRYRMVKAIPANSGNGAWSNTVCSSCRKRTTDLNAASCGSCGSALLRPVVRTPEGWRLVRGFKTSSYTRMKPDVPAATITTASGHLGSDKTIHPWENRVLSMRECAYLQTLPEDFEWSGALAKWGHSNVREMIGEAVPPRFTEQHGLALKSVLTGNSLIALLASADERVTRATDVLDAAASLSV